MAKIGINIATGSLQKEEIIVGIDLGTTNSLIAIIHPDTKEPTVLKEFDHTALVPSIIYFGEGGNVSIGNEAKDHLISHPQNTIFSVKRLMGKSYNDLQATANFFSYDVINDNTENLVKINVQGRFYTPVELSSFILKALKQRAEHILKTPVSRAVITVPAYFNDVQRQATRDAGKLAGLDVLRIINEPTAASLAYGIGLKKNEEKTVAVYDLGGGTFDISILRISDGVFEVLSTNGDTYLGGDDFDKAIMEFWVQQYEWLHTKDGIVKEFIQALRLKAEEAKIALSHTDSYQALLGEKTVEITRTIFENTIKPMVEKTIQLCKNAMEDAGITLTEINEVVLVGGSTRVPLVKSSVEALFKKKAHTEMNPDEIVALGAAIQADVLAGNNKDLLLLDITPLSLGIETMGGLMDVLIPRNSKIPAKASRQYTTLKDGQGSMRISVYQGERDLVKDNRKLAEFNLSGIPGMPAGLPKIEVSFFINADGILVVKAKELRSGVEQEIQVQPQSGLSDDDVEQMLMESITNAQDDMLQRALVEARTEAKVLLETTSTFLSKNSDILTPEEMKETNVAVQDLEQKISSGNKDDIQQAIEKLNLISQPYAERLMDQAISNAMKGKKI